MNSKVANWRHWSCQITHLSDVDEVLWLWAAFRAFETMDSSHGLRRALPASVRASAHTQGIVNSDLEYVWRQVTRNNIDVRTALVTNWYCGRQEENNVVVSCRGRVTKVAAECIPRRKRIHCSSIRLMKKNLFMERTLER